MPELTRVQEELAALINRIFEDGRVDPGERAELRDFWAARQMTVGQVRQVVDAFVAGVWGEVIADGVVTDEERGRLQAVVDGLRLPREALPEEIHSALAGG